MKIIQILMLGILFTSCSDKENKKDIKPAQQQLQARGNTIVFDAEQVKNGGIDTGRIPLHELSGTIRVNGQVDVPPENLIAVNVPLGGFLKRTTMLPGQPVRKGQILAEVQNQDYITIQQDYLTAVSKIVFFKEELERQKVLSQQGASPVKLYQQSVSEYASEQAQAAGLSQKLRLLGINPRTLTPATIRSVISITAPINGFVSRVNVSTGKYINPSEVLMELVNTSDIHAALTVFEQDISRIRIGNLVRITLPSQPGKVYPGKVILIGHMLDTAHSVMVHCHFLKTDKTLLPNMFIQANINARSQNIVAVPDNALVSFGGQKYVFMASPKGKQTLFSMLPVEVGIQQQGWNEIHLKKPELLKKSFVLNGAFSILAAMKNTGGD